MSKKKNGNGNGNSATKKTNTKKKTGPALVKHPSSQKGWGAVDIDIPNIVHEDEILKLSRKRFPGTRSGKMAWCDYNVAIYEARKESFKTGGTEKAKLEALIKKEQARMDKHLAKLAELG